MRFDSNYVVVSAEFAQSGRKSRFRDEVVEDDAWVDPNGNVSVASHQIPILMPILM